MEIINIKKEKYVVFIIGFLFAFWVRLQQNNEIFRLFMIGSTFGRVKFYIFYVLSFIISILFYAFFIWGIFELGRWKQAKYISFFKFFFIYLGIQSIILFFIWPGYFRGDEIITIGRALSDLSIYWDQTFYLYAIVVVGLMIVPYLVFLTFFQLVVISIFASCIFCEFGKLLNHKRWSYALLVPYLLFPVLDSNQNVIRNSIISWIILYCIVKLYVEYKCNGMFEKKKLVLISVLLAFVAVWKTELIYLIPIYIALVIIVNKKVWKETAKNYLSYLSILVACLFIFRIPDTFFAPDNNYILTSVLTSVSNTMIKYDGDCAEIVKNDYDVLSDFVSIEEVRIDEFGKTGLFMPMAYYEKDILNADEKMTYMKSAIRYLGHYWKDFVANRWHIFAYANGYVPDALNQNFTQGYEYEGGNFLENYFRYTNIGNYKLRAKVIKILTCRNDESYSRTNWLFGVMYNSTIGIVGLLALFITALVKKKYVHNWVSGTLILYFFIIFWISPAPFFMYYMPLYLASFVYLTIVFVEKIDWKRNSHNQ